MAFVALFIATLLTATELLSGSYPRTWFLIFRKVPLLAYSLLYGVLALGVMIGLDALVQAKKIQFEGLMGGELAQAIAVGLTTKALLNINVFTVSVGSQSVPIGPAVIVRLFEPHFLRSLLLAEFHAVRAFTFPHAEAYPDLDVVKRRIKESIPPTLPREERAAFAMDIDEADEVRDALEHFLRFVGRNVFVETFPPG